MLSLGVFIKYNFVFLLFQNTIQEMSLFFALQLRYISFSSDVEIISSILCILFLIWNIIMILWLRKITDQIIVNKCFDVPKEYQFIFENLDLTRKHTLYFPIIKICKKFLLSFCVVFLYYEVAALALCLIFLSFSMYLFIRIIEPFENKYRNMVAEMTEILQSCLFGLLFLYYTCRMETTDDTALYIGYLTIIIVVIIIVLNFGVLIINLFYGIATYICKFNTLGEMVKLGDLISEKIESIKMKEFTYEKVWIF